MVNKRFIELRKKVMKAISEIDLSNGCKSYEGTFEWVVGYPNYFEDETGDRGAYFFKLVLHCYVIGPGRHYEWTGKTMDEVLKKAEKDIDRWIGEEDGK
jgi:hypothetical protein